MAARLANREQVRTLFLERLSRQVNATGDNELQRLHDEVSSYPVPSSEKTPHDEASRHQPSPIQVPLRIRTPFGELAMFSTMATFGTPADVTLAELAIELFYPLDDFTADVLRAHSVAGPAPEGLSER
ncbi:hypothetical protein [Nonomuraea sp. NPDC049758]|uniref:MmyB family transcriptional regulator n=1 Tax=Nonomuraea sp. NPDC049758 TaxID=3154360 RepID=UPI0034477B52